MELLVNLLVSVPIVLMVIIFGFYLGKFLR